MPSNKPRESAKVLQQAKQRGRSKSKVDATKGARPGTGSSSGGSNTVSYVSSASSMSSTGAVLQNATNLDVVEIFLQVLIVVVPLCVIGGLAGLTISQAWEIGDESMELEVALVDGTALAEILNAIGEEEIYTCSYIAEKQIDGDIDTATQLLRARRADTDKAFRTAEWAWNAHGFGDINDAKVKVNGARLHVDQNANECTEVIQLVEKTKNI